ncbi:unnamed protein product [Durusdinium trenchii]|uniref:Pentatricopeptide repeat-containing protein n=1 Tax=Durusdinium trenchii TaxID=1381693 RepID=A0ABP0R552_9DINO
MRDTHPKKILVPRLNLLRAMVCALIQSNLMTCSALISACEKGRRWQHALILLETMIEKGYLMDVLTFNAAISACEKSGQWCCALGLLDQMLESQLQANDISFNAIISACEKGSQWQRAISLLDMIPLASAQADVISFTSALSSCEKEHLWQQALSLMDAMQCQRIQPNAVTLSVACHAFERGWQPQKAVSLLGAPFSPIIDLRMVRFAVYRPTSRDAIAKMLSGAAVGALRWADETRGRAEERDTGTRTGAKQKVGKGLNVKGKSAKLNRLSGFVPFLQISQENDKAEVAPSPSDACVTIYFASDELRSRAASQLQSLLDSADLHVQEDHLIALDDYPNTPGLILPEPLLHYAFIDKPDIQPAVGWETGRISSPAFMDMNLQALRGDSKPKVVLYQFDQDNAMNPHGLLIAYAEATVKPVVSDFDTFTVGSRGMTYKRLHPEQADLAMWALKHTEQLLRKPSLSSWTSRWLEVLKEAHDEGFHPDIPEYGFGDETSYKLIEGIVEATSESGAVRHGAECFNFYFPQELDDNYLVVWEGFDDKPWAYMDEDALRDFLEERVEEDYAMPLNPVWCVRDQGWYDVLEAQISNDACKKIMEAWYPEGSGILEKIEELHKEFPNGFQTGLPPGEEGRRPTLRSTLSTVNDLDTTEKAILASSMAKSGRSRWGEAIRKVHLMQSMSRHSLMPRSVSPA